MTLVQNLRSWANELTGYLVYLLLVATLGPFLFGYHIAELNAPQDVLTCKKKSITLSSGLPQCIPMTALEIGLVASALTAGGFVGALAGGPLTASYGRLRPMRWITLFFVTGPVAEAFAPSIPIMVIGRFISGIGAGATLVVVPLYISEIAPVRQKGFFGAFSQIQTNAGIFTTQLLGYFLSHDNMWRVILAAAGIVGLAQLAGLIFAVESPKWQANHGQARIARSNLQRIRGRDADLSEETKGWHSASSGAEGEEESLLRANDDSQHHRSDKNATLGMLEVLRHPYHGPATFAAMMVLAAQQFSGINAIIMYGVSLLGELLQANSALLNIFVSLLNIVMTTACAPLLDVLGRKTCLMSSMTGMSISSVLLGIGIKTSFPALSTVAVLLFVASFSLGLGPVPFMLASELVGPEAVGASQSWGLASNWVATFLIAQFFPLVNERLGKGNVFFIFAGLDVFFFVLVLFLIPETKDKKDADEVWGRQSRRED